MGLFAVGCLGCFWVVLFILHVSEQLPSDWRACRRGAGCVLPPASLRAVPAFLLRPGAPGCSYMAPPAGGPCPCLPRSDRAVLACSRHLECV